MASSEAPFARVNWDAFIKKVMRGTKIKPARNLRPYRTGGNKVLYQAAVISIEEEAVLGASDNLELWQDEVDTLQVRTISSHNLCAYKKRNTTQQSAHTRTRTHAHRIGT